MAVKFTYKNTSSEFIDNYFIECISQNDYIYTNERIKSAKNYTYLGGTCPLIYVERDIHSWRIKFFVGR